METREITLPLGPDREFRAVLGIPGNATMDAILILGHGAANTMDQPLIAGVHERLTREGLVHGALQFSLLRRRAKSTPTRTPPWRAPFVWCWNTSPKWTNSRAWNCFWGANPWAPA